MTETIIFISGYIVGMIALVFPALLLVNNCWNGKEPEFVEIRDNNGNGHWICPICGEDVSFYEDRNNFCSACGQKIDWRKVQHEPEPKG